MYLDIVLIDVLDPDGVLRTYKIKPKDKNDRVIIDRIRDVYPEHFDSDELDMGGNRIYNSSQCKIETQAAKLRNFKHINNSIFFQFEHMGIPLGPSREAHGGIYNFLLAPGWRLSELYISDPFDKTNENLKNKKQFRYSPSWDSTCSVQLIDMELRSGRGSFSFIVSGVASLAESDDDKFIDSYKSDWKITNLMNNHLIDEQGKKVLSKELAEKADWLELKPNIMGIGINFNQIIKDSIATFRRKMQKEI